MPTPSPSLPPALPPRRRRPSSALGRPPPPLTPRSRHPSEARPHRRRLPLEGAGRPRLRRCPRRPSRPRSAVVPRAVLGPGHGWSGRGRLYPDRGASRAALGPSRRGRPPPELARREPSLSAVLLWRAVELELGRLGRGRGRSAGVWWRAAARELPGPPRGRGAWRGTSTAAGGATKIGTRLVLCQDEYPQVFRRRHDQQKPRDAVRHG